MSEEANSLAEVAVAETNKESPELVSGVAWSTIESLPEDWTVNNLESNIKITTGNNFSSDYFADEGGIPLVRIRDLDTDETTVNYTGKFDDKFLVQDFDLLVGMDGEFEPHFWSGGRALLNQRVCRIEADETYNQVFLRYGLDKPLRYIQKSIAGTTVKHLSQSNIRSINLPTPALEEQRNIASVLYTVDQAVQNSEDIISRLESIRTGTLRNLFTGGVGDNDTKGTPMGEFPQNWEIEQMSSVGKLINGSAFPKEHQGRKDGDYPFVKVSDTNDYRRYVTGAENYISEAQADEIGCTIHPEETVILPKRGAAIMTNKRRILAQDSAIDNNQIGIVGKAVEPLFLYYYLSDVDMGRFVQEGAVKSLTKSLLSMIRVPVPPTESQSEIIDILDTIDARIEAEVRVKSRYEQLKQGLMQDLLTGEVRTHEKDIEILDEVVTHG